MATAGERPGVTVQQEFVTPSPILEDPDLPVCLVGRAIQIEEDQDAGEYTGLVLANVLYPELKLNAVVDVASVVVNLQTINGTFDITADTAPGTEDFDVNASITVTRNILTGATAGSCVNPTNIFTDLTKKFISLGVLAGDVVTFLSGTLALTPPRNVATVTSQTAIVLDGAALPTENNIAYSITRTEAGVGTLLVSYEAAREDLNDVLVTILDDDNIESLVGLVDPRNPAGYAVSKARLNANNRKVLFTGVSEDTVSEYTRALEFLESKEIYHAVPLTQDVAILALVQPHVDTASELENKHERIGWLNRELVVRETKISSSQLRTFVFDNGTGVLTDDAGGFFDFNDYISVGDFIVYDDGSVHELLVQTILSPLTVSINVPGSVAHPGANVATTAYTAISDEKTKTEQAEYLASYASSFADRRIVVTWPDQVEVSFDGVLQVVPGYFLSAATSGLKSGQRPQQPLTNLAVAGFTRLFNSNTYFNEGQLKILDAGGIMVHEQLATDGVVTVRRQRTTDTSDLKKTELSIVTIVDFVAKYLRQELAPYVGRYNITPEYLDMLKVVINGLTARLKENTEVGPVILEGQLISIEQNSVELDTVDILYQIEAPVPANFLRVRLQV